MPAQSALRIDEVPVNCPTQARYHTIAPYLAGKASPAEQANPLNLSYSTVGSWLRQFREHGMSGLFPAGQYQHEPCTPERVIVTLLYSSATRQKLPIGKVHVSPFCHHLAFHLESGSHTYSSTDMKRGRKPLGIFWLPDNC